MAYFTDVVEITIVINLIVMLTNSFRRFVAVALVALLWGTQLPLTQAGYAPSRAALTHPTRSSAPSLNNYSDSTHAYYSDERAFAMVSRSNNTGKGDSLNLTAVPGEIIKFYSYFNNSSAQTATNVETYTDSFYRNTAGQYVTVPFTSAFEVKHYIKGGNTVPSLISDTARVVPPAGTRLRLRYVPGDGNMRVTPLGSVTRSNVSTAFQPDFFDSAAGIAVGDKDGPLSGTLAGGDGRDGTTDNRVEMDYKVVVESAAVTFDFTKQANVSTAIVGDQVQYTLSYTNQGPVEATGVTIVDTFDASKLTIQSSSLPSNCVLSGTTITCTIAGEVASGASGSVTYQATVTDPGTLTNSATLTSNMSDSQTATATVTVSERPYTPKADTILESGTGATNWVIYDNDPAGATVTSVDDAVKGKAIRLQGSGDGVSNGWRLGTNFNISDQLVAQWAWKISSTSARIYWVVDTNVGQRYLQYFPNDRACYQESNPQYITCGLGSLSAENKWYIHVRDLQLDISTGQPGTTITNIRQMIVRGNSLITDVKLKSDSHYKISGVITRNGLGVANAVVRFGIENVLAPVLTDANGVYKRIGITNGNYTMQVSHSGTFFTPNTMGIVINNADYVQDFLGLDAPATTYEDGNGSTNWVTYDNDPIGSTVSTVLDSNRGNVIQFVSSGAVINNAWRLGDNWANSGQLYAQWAWKVSNTSGRFYWLVDTNKGLRYIQYFLNDTPCYSELNPQYITCGLGSYSADGNWYIHTRNLATDVAFGQPGTIVTRVRQVIVRGSSFVDDIKLFSSLSSFHKISGTITRDGSVSESVKITFGTNMPAPVRTNINGYYEQIGFPDGTYNVSAIQTGTLFPTSPASVNISGSDYMLNFTGVKGSGTLYEDGSGYSNWTVYDPNPAGIIQSLKNSGKNGVGDYSIQLSGTPPALDHSDDELYGGANGTGFMFSADWKNNGQLTALWDVKTLDDLAVYFELNTSLGRRFVEYNTFQAPNTCVQASDNIMYIICGLPSNIKNGSWNSVIKNIQTDYAGVQVGIQVYNIVRMRVRGNLLIDNIQLQ